jgi:hypothetical protein
MTEHKAEWLALALLVSVTAIIVSLDIWLIEWFGFDASISRVVGRLFQRWPSFFIAAVFWAGLLVGHLWLPAR